ncbi:MAG: AIR synthase-related protein, partial [Thermomicrobiales bacterium]
ACTDVTGFSLLGHAFEIAEKSGVGLRVSAASVPLLPGAEHYAADGHQPGGLGRNRSYFARHPRGGVTIDATVRSDLSALLFGPETSGGLLLTVPVDQSARFEASFAETGYPLWHIGEVVDGVGIEVTP